jgi:heme/copper-type cytochrome/quinol oxidase subunit 2
MILLTGGIACTQVQAVPVHVIEVLADKDSRYKIAGERKPEITVKAGEQILLRITARKGKSWNRDGSIHGFSLLRAKDRSKVPGWDLLLKPGAQEFSIAAPDQPGEYVVVCTVICSEEHEGMFMKFVVTP